MNDSFRFAVLVTTLALSASVFAADVSPVTGETEVGGGGVPPTTVSGPRASGVASAPIPGALYGTDGVNLYTVDKTTGATTLIGSLGNIEVDMGAITFDAAGVLYGTSVTSSARLYTIDPGTGAATAVGPLNTGFIFEGGLAFDGSGNLFAVNEGDAQNGEMVSIDKTTGAGTIVGPSPGQARDLDDLAFDGTTLYAIDRVSNTLGTVNTTTGLYTAIGDPGASIGASGGLAFDPADGTLYASFADTNGFYRLNKSTGAGTFIGPTNVIWGLAFAPIAGFGCGSTPVTGCQPAAAKGASLALGNGKASWKWKSSAAVAVSDFGNPLTTTNYLLCVYDAAGEKLSASVPAEGMCGTKPCWTTVGSVGFKYVNKASTPDGITKVKLKAGDAEKAKIVVNGAGADLHLPALPLATPVKVQLRQDGSSTCWEATYSTAIQNTATGFKAKSD
jgi:hypothetical protein